MLNVYFDRIMYRKGRTKPTKVLFDIAYFYI